MGSLKGLNQKFKLLLTAAGFLQVYAFLDRLSLLEPFQFGFKAL